MPSAEYLKRRAALLRRNYGITLEEYDEMLEKQGGVCAICQRPPKSRPLNVDHDHKLGKTREAVRGLICGMDNRALAYLRDNPGNAERASAYLRKPPAWEVLGTTPGELRPSDPRPALRRARPRLRLRPTLGTA